MPDLVQHVCRLNRPRLLVSAARAGLVDYDRTRELRRLLRLAAVPSPCQALGRLLDQEEKLEDTRLRGDAAYSVARHIQVLIAVMGEARLAARAAMV